MRDRNTALGLGEIVSLAWDKMGGLLPAVVQDSRTGQVLMLAYMNREALAATLERGLATFFSRSKGRLWRKGETSGAHLAVEGVYADCDGDALRVDARPAGPTCHLGTVSCFGEQDPHGVGWLLRLAEIVRERAKAGDPASYTAGLLAEGPARVAQKIGEEGVELALAAVTRDRVGCIEECADLIYHLAVLMEARGFDWDDVVATLRERHIPYAHISRMERGEFPSPLAGEGVAGGDG